MNENRYILPVAIIGAGIIVAGALYYVLRPAEPELVTATDLAGDVRPVDAEDHIFGNPTAPVMLVEYSDIDSSYAKIFETSLRAIVAEHGSSGDVAWVYRHLPVIDEHPAAVRHAEAAECVAAQGGSPAFFSFLEEVHAAAPGNVQFNPANYGPIVTKLGLDADAFAKCTADHTYQKRVADDASNALNAGAVGAPYTVLLVEGQEPVPIEGLITLDMLRATVADSLKQAE